MLYRRLLTPSRLRVLREAAEHPKGQWKPTHVAGDHRMARRLAKDGFGVWDPITKTFTINGIGRDAANERG